MLKQAVPLFWAAMNSWFTPTALFVLLNLVIGTILVTSKGIRKVHPHTKDEDGGGFLHHHFPRLDDHHHALPQLFRSPSSVLERLKSIGSLSRYRSGEIPSETAAVSAPAPAPAPAAATLVSHREPEQLLRSPSSVLERLKSIGSLYRYRDGEIPSKTAAVAAPAPAAATLASHGEPEAENTFETLDDAYKAAAEASSSDHHFSRSQSDSDPTAGEMPVKLPAKLKKSASAKSAFAHFEEEVVTVRPPPATTRPSHQAEDEEVDAKADNFINRFRQQLKLQRLDSIMGYNEMLTRGR